MDDMDDDPDKLKPYKKDLEYLDDHFKLITFKLKVKGMDTRIEMEVMLTILIINHFLYVCLGGGGGSRKAECLYLVLRLSVCD